MKDRLCGSVRFGFTLIEICVLMVVLSIIAMLAIPMLSSAADAQVRTAANVIAADLEYVKNLAITHQRLYCVVFNLDTESYEVRDSSDTVITHPVKTGQNFVVNFSTDSRTSQVDITAADFDDNGDHAITFDYLGTPYSGLASGSPPDMDSGTVTVQSGAVTMNVIVEPMTGYINVQ
jgi:Tfp pilus assembly protein FimT